MAWTARPLPRRPLHPLASEEDGEALASGRGHPAGALRQLRRKGRKQKQVRGVGQSARVFFVILFRWFFFLLRWLTMWVPPARAAAVAQDGAAEMAQHKVDGV
jgi:hypothetical protein